MEDLDLDELDQAVNKMMDKSPKGKQAPKKEAPTSSAPAAHASAPKPEPAAAEPASSPRPTEEPARVAVNRPMPRVPERRRMHPGAMDIIQPLPPKAAQTRPNRVGVSLQPTSPAAPEPAKPVASPSATPAPSAPPIPAPKPVDPLLDTSPQDVSDDVLASLSLNESQKAPAEPAAPPKPTGDGWPDPLDFHDLGDKEDTSSADALLKEPAETPPSIDTERVSITAKEDDAANATPFVTTKVEKRPLGAYADATPEPPKADLPAPVESPVPHESTSKEEMAEASFESKQHLAADDHAGVDNLRSMAIPPQYHTAEQQPSDKVHPLYDTKEYHAPPQHMHGARKSGGPGLVIGVVVLIVLIVAVALVGYFMLTGTFDVTQLL